MEFLGHKIRIWSALIDSASFPKCLNQFILLLPARILFALHSCQHLTLCLFHFSHFGWCVTVFHCDINLHFHVSYEIKHWTLGNLLLWSIFSRLLAIFKLGCMVFSYWFVKSSLHIMVLSPLSDTCIINVFSILPFVLMVPFHKWK